MPETVVGAVLLEAPMAYEKVVAVVNPDGSPLNIPSPPPASSLMTGTAPNVPDSAAADVATLVADFNGLLAALAARGVITNT